MKVATDSQVAKVFTALYLFVKKNGTNETPKSSFGGIWSAEGIWEYSGIRAMQSDGGYCESINADGLRAYLAHSDGNECRIEFYEGDEAKLTEVAMQVCRDFGSLND